MAWSDLTMSQRAEVIQMAVKNGMRDLSQIRSFYNDSINKFAMGGPKGDDEEEETIMDKVAQNAHVVTRPVPTAIDRILHFADVHGAPSHVTNALRDVSNRAANEPVIMANAAYNFLTGKGDLKESYKQADINPSPLFQLFEVKPKLNTEANYSQKELAAMDELSRRSQSSEVGQITHKGYRAVNAEKYNEGRYAGDISLGNFFSPSKVVEWSLGQTSGKKEKNDNYTTDNFAYDTKDTRHVYLSNMRHGKASPAMWLRGVLGVQGSKGYDKGDSATAIRSKISVKAQQKANKKGS